MNEMNDPGSGLAQQSGSNPGSQTMDTIQERAEVARDEMSHVADSARHEIRSFADEAKTQVRGRIDEEGAHLNDAVRQFGGQLADMGRNADDPDGPAARAVAQLGERVTTLADQYQDRGVNGVLEDVKAYARRRPGQFIAIAAAAGFVVGRLIRNVDTAALTSQMQGQGSDSSRLGQDQDIIDLTAEGERALPPSEPMVGSTASGAGRPSVAGIAGEEVGTW
jgi:ElaB/YqjD/DUF883 family membrane-anchored ribosome-binding protein